MNKVKSVTEIHCKVKYIKNWKSCHRNMYSYMLHSTVFLIINTIKYTENITVKFRLNEKH